MVVGHEIVRDVNIRIAIAVDIVYNNAQTPPIGKYSSARGHIFVYWHSVNRSFIPEQLIYAVPAAIMPLSIRCIPVVLFDMVFQQIYVEVTVEVVVKKRGLHAIAGVGQTYRCGHLFEERYTVFAHALVYKQQIG